MVTVADMHLIPEDERIRVIGEQAKTQLVGVLLETNDTEKIARYIHKVTGRFPDVQHIDTEHRLTARMSVVRFGPKVTN